MPPVTQANSVPTRSSSVAKNMTPVRTVGSVWIECHPTSADVLPVGRAITALLTSMIARNIFARWEGLQLHSRLGIRECVSSCT